MITSVGKGIETVGVIGIGKMGLPMVSRLQGMAFRVGALDSSQERLDLAVGLGAFEGRSPVRLADESDVLLLSLPDAPALESVMEGPNGVLRADLKGKVIVDTTTSTRELAVRLASKVEAQGGKMLDAPVTGGVGGAESGKLTFFVGGDPDALERVRPVLEGLSIHIGHMGGPGTGQLAKMTKQMLGSVKFCIAAEVLGFARATGLPIPALVEALGETSILTQMLRMAETQEFGQEGYLAQRGKDLDYALFEARLSGCYTPITEAMQQMFTIARERGLGHMDPQALSLLYREDGE